MAEFVQSNLESMIPELEQMERVKLLEKAEVNEILKRRKRFEYKLQKQNKDKSDFLAYIQYEIGVLSLIEIRRQKLGYFHKKSEIDYAVAGRVHKLYKILERRFQGDVKIWLSHIDFQKRMKWTDQIGRTYRRMLQVHATEASLWVAAAKYEMEERGSAENARNIFQEAIRLNPKSRELYREYFRLELMYVEQLKKRSELLLAGKEATPVAEPSAETRDAVMEECKIATTVFGFAAKAFPDDAQFLCSMLGVAFEFEFASAEAEHPVRRTIEEHLWDHFPDSPAVWDTKARLALRDGGDDSAARLRNCLDVYDEALAKCGDDGAQMLALCLECLYAIAAKASAASTIPDALTAAIMEKLELGDARGWLSEQHYADWLYLIDGSGGDECRRVLESAVAHHPESTSLLTQLFTADFEEDREVDETAKKFLSFAEKLDCKKPAAADLWRMVFANVAARDENAAEEMLTKAAVSYPKVAPSLRALLLDRIFTERGLEAARQMYDAEAYAPPFGMELHAKMIELERMDEKKSIDVKRVRKAFECATDQFGGEDPAVWADLVAFEATHGKGKRVAAVRNRAITALKGSKDLREQFELACESALAK